MSDPRRTGMSAITGRTVTIRHANEIDLAIVGEFLEKDHKEAYLAGAEVVVAAENDRIIGFGVLKKERNAGCVSLFEDSKRRGIGSSIMKHLMDFAAVKRVYAARYASYFTHAGAAHLRKFRAAQPKTNGKSCPSSLMERLAIPVYRKA